MNKNKLFCILVILALLMAAVPVMSAGAAGTVVVMPSATNGWSIFPTGDVAVTTNNAIGKIVVGPGGQPGGLLPGSVEYRTNSLPGGKPQLYAPSSLVGVKFTELTTLSYSTYISQYASGSPWLVHAINVKIDLDGDLTGTTADRYTMVFEPCYTASCSSAIQPLNTWSTWNALASGAIWWSTGSIPGTAFTVPFNSYAPLTSIYATYPNAVISFLVFQAGQGSGGAPWNDFIGNLDGVIIGVNGDNTTYDFEPTPSDIDGPITTSVVASSNPAAVNSSVTVTANVDDVTTGGSNIASAEYSLDGGATWTPIAASDAAFDAVSEDVAVNIPASGTPGVYNLCVRGTDVAGNTGSPECTMFVVYDPSAGFVTGGGWIDSPAAQDVAGFNTIPDPLAGNYPSQPYQAQQTAEFGDHIQFAGTARDLSSVTVTMSSWAKHSDYPAMPPVGFTHPLTLNIYNVDKSGTAPALGTLIKSVTQNFVMQWRPEGDPSCPNTGYGAGFAWKASNGTCYNGFAFNVVFDLNNEGITLPDEIIYGIASNTQTWGYAPIGAPGPYNSLNFALNNMSGPSTGTDVEPDAAFLNTETAGWYSDGGLAGVGTFRRDTGWTGYVPAVRFSFTSPGAYTSDPTLGGKATFGFVSKYKKGATVPDGNTEFQFKAGNLNFSSTSYEWLVVNQAGANAQFKGTGTINGAGSYGFMLWASDGAPDTFRIKIWDVATEVVVYDNGVNQPIGGGSIVVHKK